jgi:hypothetical protein
VSSLKLVFKQPFVETAKAASSAGGFPATTALMSTTVGRGAALSGAGGSSAASAGSAGRRGSAGRLAGDGKNVASGSRRAPRQFLRTGLLEKGSRKDAQLRRRQIPHFALYRRNFIPLFYGVSEIFMRPRKIPLWILSWQSIFGLFIASSRATVEVAASVAGPGRAAVEEARHTPFCPLQEKFHTFVLRGLRNISEAP